MDKKEIAKYLDCANHHPEATPEAIRAVCKKVKDYGFHSAFVNPCFVPLAKELLGQNGVVGTVVSFPLGQDATEAKVFASIEATRRRADELDVSMNVGLFKAGDEKTVLEEMKEIVGAVKAMKEKTIVKFIIETGLLTDDEIKRASELVVESGADFVKTCSGMGPRGARLTDVALIKEAIGDKARIKVAGGVKNYEQAAAFIAAGAVQIGTSKAVEIISEED